MEVSEGIIVGKFRNGIYLRAIREIVLREVNLSERAFTNEPSESVIPDMSKVFRVEFSGSWSVAVPSLTRGVHTQGARCRSLQAVGRISGLLGKDRETCVSLAGLLRRPAPVQMSVLLLSAAVYPPCFFQAAYRRV